MERLVILFTVVVGIANAIPAPGHGSLVGYCDNSSHCGIDECCVSFNQPRGKRTVLSSLDPNLMHFVHGSCQKLGTDASKCFVNNLKTGTSGLYYDCPCADGYTCEGSGMAEIPKGEYGVCSSNMKVGRAAHTPCSSGADCAATECCISNFRPIGKRGKVQKRQHNGFCAPMGTEKSSCLVKLGSGKPDDMVYSCPCMTGLTCHGLGFIEVPLGERGTCGVL